MSVIIFSVCSNSSGEVLGQYHYDSKNIYTFPQYTLISWASVKVWTKAGIIDPENVYWGRTDPVWNDHGDCAYLRDDKHKLMDKVCYGNRGFLQSLFSNIP